MVICKTSLNHQFAIHFVRMLVYKAYLDITRVTIDKDECESHNGMCQQICNNTLGSRSCSCFDGYTLSPNARTCIGKSHFYTSAHL